MDGSFQGISKPRTRNAGCKSNKYFDNPSVDVFPITEYLNIFKLCVKMNTDLTARAVMERFGALCTLLVRHSRLRPNGLYILRY